MTSFRVHALRHMSTLDDIREASGAAFNAITAEIRAKIAEFNDQPSYWESFRAFIAAVDWQVHSIPPPPLSDSIMVHLTSNAD